jgi:16S rRNA (cytosine967-C5)-methyltransferase
LRSGGRLVYSTCSLEKRENEEVIEKVAGNGNYQIVETHYRIPGKDPGDGFFVSVLTV